MALGTGRGTRTPRRPPPSPRPSQSAYARRQAAAERVLGKPWAQFTPEEKRRARGHARESEEKKARRARIKERYGVSPEKLVQLRRAVVVHMRSELGGVPFSARHRPDFGAVDENIKRLGGEALMIMLEYDADSIRGLAHLSYEELIEAFPEFANDEGLNPFWYH